MDMESLVQKLPGVASPLKRLTFRDKLKWTSSVLLLYFVLSQIPLYGMAEAAISQFKSLEAIMGASFGSLITLGIGPIVSASIILQLLVGSGIIGWDLSSHHGKVMFQGTQKILAIAFTFLEAAAYTLFGAVQAIPGFELLIIAQLSMGGILIIFLDEVVSKWGFGSGVSLFIAAGVSKQIIIAAFNPQIMGTLPTGKVVALIATIIQGSPDLSLLLPIIATLVVFAIVVYAQAMKVEIPLAFGSIRGFGRKWPLKFIYASVIPVILVSALLINLKVWASMLANKGYPFLGSFDPSTGNPISGIVYYLSPPNQFIWNLLHLNIIGDEVIRVILYTLFMVVGSMIFAVFWVNTAGMSAKHVARQIQGIGMQIPGFRRDPRIIEGVLDRYIPPLAVLGGAFVGFLAAFADFTGALAGGTSILLAVMIIYNFYEELAMQHMEDMHPLLRKFIKR